MAYSITKNSAGKWELKDGRTLISTHKLRRLATSKRNRLQASGGSAKPAKPKKPRKLTPAQARVKLCAEVYKAKGKSNPQAYAMCNRMEKDGNLDAAGNYIRKGRRADTDERACPGCGRLGTPQHDSGWGTTIYRCEHPRGCDYEDQWEVEREDSPHTPDGQRARPPHPAEWTVVNRPDSTGYGYTWDVTRPSASGDVLGTVQAATEDGAQAQAQAQWGAVWVYPRGPFPTRVSGVTLRKLGYALGNPAVQLHDLNPRKDSTPWRYPAYAFVRRGLHGGSYRRITDPAALLRLRVQQRRDADFETAATRDFVAQFPGSW